MGSIAQEWSGLGKSRAKMNAFLTCHSGKTHAAGRISVARIKKQQQDGPDAMFGIKKDLYRNFSLGFAVGAVIVLVHFFGAAEALAF